MTDIMNRFKRSSEKPADEKILVVSLQKCGTHLLFRILSAAGLEGVGVGPQCKLQDFNRLRMGQYLWTHFPPADEVLMALEDSQKPIRLVLNYRDPRDAIVSWFYWLHPENKKVTHLHREYMKKVYAHFNDRELLDIFIKMDKFREVEYCIPEQFRYARALLFHPAVHKARFEDLIGNDGGGCDKTQREAIASLFRFLDVPLGLVDKATNEAFDRNSETFRKGEIGGYKEAMSLEQIQAFNRLYDDLLRQYGYPPD